MDTVEEIPDYVNNHDPNAAHVGLEEFALCRRHGAAHTTTDTIATTETRARVYSAAPSRTKIPGRSSTQCDPGSRVNIIGATTPKNLLTRLLDLETRSTSRETTPYEAMVWELDPH